ncbi:hypothetical protein Pelo_12568 [Pelomyxa schiedti]|nr:hypothetical protein Pelo_12568 [Pelomyxa schiedti]
MCVTLAKSPQTTTLSSLTHYTWAFKSGFFWNTAQMYIFTEARRTRPLIPSTTTPESTLTMS